MNPYEVILPNGDRAEAEDLNGALYTADRLLKDAFDGHYGALRIARREVIVTLDGVYNGAATAAARAGRTR